MLGQIVQLLMPSIVAAAQSGDLLATGILSQALKAWARPYSPQSLAQSRTGPRPDDPGIAFPNRMSF